MLRGRLEATTKTREFQFLCLLQKHKQNPYTFHQLLQKLLIPRFSCLSSAYLRSEAFMAVTRCRPGEAMYIEPCLGVDWRRPRKRENSNFYVYCKNISKTLILFTNCSKNAYCAFFLLIHSLPPERGIYGRDPV